MATRLDDIRWGRQGAIRALRFPLSLPSVWAAAIALLLALGFVAAGIGVPVAHADESPGYEVATDPFADAVPVDLADGSYQVEVVLEGGSGKATVASPADFEVFDGRAVVQLVWSSPYYDYMIVAGKKYLPVNEEGDSTFVVPVTAYDEPVSVIGDTTAMSEAHEVSYTIMVSRSSAKALRDGKRTAISAAADASANASADDRRESGLSWPWIVFGVCAVLSVACIASSVVLVRNYHSRTSKR